MFFQNFMQKTKKNTHTHPVSCPPPPFTEHFKCKSTLHTLRRWSWQKTNFSSTIFGLVSFKNGGILYARRPQKLGYVTNTRRGRGKFRSRQGSQGPGQSIIGKCSSFVPRQYVLEKWSGKLCGLRGEWGKGGRPIYS